MSKRKKSKINQGKIPCNQVIAIKSNLVQKSGLSLKGKLDL